MSLSEVENETQTIEFKQSWHDEEWREGQTQLVE